MAIGQTWPLASRPGTLSRNDNADTILNEWTLAWVAHQMPRDPVHLFDANIFHPERDTLAYSEHLIVPAMMGAPLFWLGASPVLVYNLLVLTGFTLTGWAAWLLVWRWTGNQAAALVSGVIFAFNANTLTRLPHLQALHSEFIPLALLAFDDVLRTPRIRPALLLAVWFVLQALTSFYSMVFLTTALVAGGLVRPDDWWGERARPVLAHLFLAAAVAGLTLVPFLLPYARLGQARPLSEVALYSAGWRDYLMTPARWHYEHWSARFFGGSTALFPGVLASTLALVAVGSGRVVTDRRARMALAFGIAGAALSFGPALPGYSTLYRWVPLLQGIRNAARFGYLAIISVAILAGFGVAAAARRRTTPWSSTVAVGLVVLVNFEILAAPIEYVPSMRIPAIYSSLRNRPGTVVAEFPFYPPDRIFHNAQYMLSSTRNWRPLVNGYSGLIPASYERHYQDFSRFPDAAALERLRAAGVTHVFVHFGDLRAWTDQETAAAVRRAPGLRLIQQEGDLTLYQLVGVDR
jgi:hypothetical protein